MKDEKTKKNFRQFVVLFVLLFISVVIIMVNFWIRGSKEEREEVTELIQYSATHTVKDIKHHLELMTRCASSVASVMENYTSEDVEIAEVVAKEICDSSAAYLAVLSNMDGEGLDNNGNWVNLSRTDYFEEAKGEEQKYCYVVDDGCEGKSAIMSSIPLYKDGRASSYLFVYYSIEDFKTTMNSMMIGEDCMYALLDDSGMIIAQASRENRLVEGINFWDAIGRNSANHSGIAEVKKDISRMKEGILYAQEKGVEESYCIFYEPLMINDWYVIVAYNGAYIENLVDEELEFSQSILYQLLAVILIFVIVTIILTILTRKNSDNHARVLEEKADTDQLTGLYNKAATERLIREYLAEHPDEQALVFLLDIDNFKKINDTMGHAFGDEVLSTIGYQLKREFRMSDIIGRTGGDEFMICLKNMKDDTITQKEIARVERFFKNFRVGEYVKYSPTASIGVSVFPKHGKDFESLYKASDQALYIAKKRGKNQVAVYGDDRTEEIVQDVQEN